MMKSLASLLLALPLAAAIPASSPSSPPYPIKRTDSTPHGIVSMPLRKVVGARNAVFGSRRLAMTMPPATGAARAVSPPRQGLIDKNEYYLADLAIGTPPQPVSLIVDTGAWVTWVNPDCAYAMRQAECSALPFYNLSLSNPAPLAVHALDQIVMYGDATMAAALEGYADVFTWGNKSQVSEQPFGVANETVGLSTGILSLGPDGIDGFNSAVSNFSVVATLAKQGLIASRVFSLAFGRGFVAATHHVGSLVFGGVDRNQFKGALGKTAILPRDASVDAWRYWLAVTQVHHNAPGAAVKARNVSTPAGNASYMIDSGTTGIYVPRDTYDAILAETNLTRNELRPEGFPDVDCGMANMTGSLSFTFAGVNSNSNKNTSGVTIDIPYAALVHPERNLLTNDTSKCYFAFSSGGNGPDDGDIFPILGVEFFKAAYTVFDWDNLEVSLGQGASCGEPDLVPVGKGSNAVPSITGNCK